MVMGVINQLNYLGGTTLDFVGIFRVYMIH